jgi:hypothetical protein
MGLLAPHFLAILKQVIALFLLQNQVLTFQPPIAVIPITVIQQIMTIILSP